MGRLLCVVHFTFFVRFIDNLPNLARAHFLFRCIRQANDILFFQKEYVAV